MPQLKSLRQLFAKLETTEGSEISLTTTGSSSDYIQCIDPEFTITPLQFDRTVTRNYFSTVPKLVPGTGSGSSDSPCAVVEFRFSVEGAVSGTTPASTAPRWARLLNACGMAETALKVAQSDNGTSGTAVATGGSPAGYAFQHGEGFAGTGATSAAIMGDYFPGETEIYVASTGVIAANTITGALSESTFKAGTTGTTAALGAAGFGYACDTANKSQGDGSSLTMELRLNGTRVRARGCRGNVEFRFAHGNKLVMTFTFMGILTRHDTQANETDSAGTWNDLALPPTLRSAALSLAETASGSTTFTSAVFSDIVFNLGNEVKIRTDANNANGYRAAIITGRKPTGTMNPDMVATGSTSSTVYDFFDSFCDGETARLKMQCGTSDGNKILVRTPALQFTGAADGDRDGVMIIDGSFDITGGQFRKAAGSTSPNAFGNDNEFILILT